MPHLTFDGHYFILKIAREERRPLALGGFRWSEGSSAWYTSDPKVAVKFKDVADDSAGKKLDQVFISDIPWQWTLPKLREGLSAYPYQPPAAFFSLKKNRSYLAIDAGLGKTIVAALILASVRTRCLYLCPPFLIRDVEAKLKVWAPGLRIFLNRRGKDFPEDCDVMILPDSFIARAGIYEDVKRWLHKFDHACLLIDEAHRYNNGDSKRTKALLGFSPRAARPVPGVVDLFYRVVYMSGTPIRNRLMELYPILSKSAPETIDFMSRFDYGLRYCNGKRTPFGWDFDGSSNQDELMGKVIPRFMLRIRKDEVLELPPKIEDVFIISDDMTPRLARLDKELFSEYGVNDLIKHRIKVKAGEEKEDLHVASYRRLLGTEKVKHAIEYLTMLLSETSESIIVFAFHTEVIELLKEGLASYRPLVITGEVDPDKRFDIVEQFQNESGRRLIIGNYIAMGIGFTMTKADRVVFVEFSYVPGENSQAIDRAHRIGQTKTLYINYMVYFGSLDQKTIEAVLEKELVLKSF